MASNKARERARKRRSGEEVNEEASVEDAIQYLTDDGTERKVRGNLHLQLHLDKLQEDSEESGLTRENLTLLLKETATCRWAESVTVKLIKCLVPRETVPIDGVLHAVSRMCTNKPSSKVQSLLIRWLVMVYELVEERDKLHSLYGILFFFLENDTMCPHVAHLLYLLTEKSDVTGHRVRWLLQLQQRYGAKPHLLALLALYKLYCPHLVAVTLPSNRKVFFKQMDARWSRILREVQQRRQRPGRQDESSLVIPDVSILVDTSDRGATTAGKRRRADILPKPASLEVAQRPMQKSTDKQQRDTVHIAQIKTAQELVDSIDCLEMPAQMGSVLTNTYMQHVLCIHGSCNLTHRLTYWLHHVLQQEFFEDSTLTKEAMTLKEKLLAAIFNLSEFLQEGIPVVENFLINYLPIWNGIHFRSRILQLITRIRLYHFSGLSEKILEPLRGLYFRSTIFFKCQILWCLTELLHNFALVELPRLQQTLHIQKKRANPAVAADDVENLVSVFAEDVDAINGNKVITDFVTWVNRVITVTLLEHPSSPLLMHYICNFYDLMSSLYPVYNINTAVIPCRAFIFSALLASEAVTLSRLLRFSIRGFEMLKELRERCKQEYKRLEETMSKENRPPAITEDESVVGKKHQLEKMNISLRSSVTVFNNILLDLARALWQDRVLFDKAQAGSVFSLLQDSDLPDYLRHNSKKAFSLWNHPALLGYAYILALQHSSQFTREEWKRISKWEYLEFLTGMGLEDLNYFFHFTIRKKSSSASQTPQASMLSEVSSH